MINRFIKNWGLTYNMKILMILRKEYINLELKLM